MSDLLELAVAAHGGLERWNRFGTLQVKMAIGGTIFDSNSDQDFGKEFGVSGWIFVGGVAHGSVGDSGVGPS